MDTNAPARRGRRKALVSSALTGLVVAVLLAGTAGALPGRNTVDRDDVQRNAIGSKQIRNGQVKAADLARPERWRVVGRPGQPQFFDGGEGDCIWTNGIEGVEGTAPVSFRKDVLGRVQLRGVATATDGPGGDGVCDRNDPGEAEDAVVLRLPAAYRPQHVDLSLLANGAVVAPSGGAVVNESLLPGGAVASLLASLALFEGGLFDPAPPGSAQAARAPATISLPELLGVAAAVGEGARSGG